MRGKRKSEHKKSGGIEVRDGGMIAALLLHSPRCSLPCTEHDSHGRGSDAYLVVHGPLRKTSDLEKMLLRELGRRGRVARSGERRIASSCRGRGRRDCVMRRSVWTWDLSMVRRYEVWIVGMVIPAHRKEMKKRRRRSGSAPTA
jgi:hypothetical protein